MHLCEIHTLLFTDSDKDSIIIVCMNVSDMKLVPNNDRFIAVIKPVN